MTNIRGVSRWERTHTALRNAALELFLTHGYDATSTARIAEHAGVSEMTLFRHFPAKDALLLDDPFDPLMAEAVRGRPPGEPPLRALAGGIDESWREIDSAEVERLRTVLSIVVATPTLQGAIERNSARTTEALADALIDRGAAEPDAHVAAAAVIAGLSRALLRWAGDPSGDPDAAVRGALRVLGGPQAC